MSCRKGKTKMTSKRPRKAEEFDDLPKLTDASCSSDDDPATASAIAGYRDVHAERADGIYRMCLSEFLTQMSKRTTPSSESQAAEEGSQQPHHCCMCMGNACTENASATAKFIADPKFGENLRKAFGTNSASSAGQESPKAAEKENVEATASKKETGKNAPEEKSDDKMLQKIKLLEKEKASKKESKENTPERKVNEPKREETKKKKKKSQQKETPKPKSESEKEKQQAAAHTNQIKDIVGLIAQVASTHLKNMSFTKAVDKYEEVFSVLHYLYHDEVSLDDAWGYALRFCYVTACLECKTVEYLEKAKARLDEMSKGEKSMQNFSHLTAYVRAQFHVRWNNYEDGLRECTVAKELISSCTDAFPPLSYPGQKDLIPISTKAEYVKQLDRLRETCQFPPKPDARCHGENCGHPRREIYRSDPKYDGHYIVQCNKECNVGFHQSCYKAFVRKLGANDEKPCLTPCCDGVLLGGSRFDKTDPTPHPFSFHKTADARKATGGGKAEKRKGKARARAQSSVRSAGVTGEPTGKQKCQQNRAKEKDEDIDDDAGAGAAAAQQKTATGGSKGEESAAFKDSRVVDHDEETLVEREAYPLRREEDDDDNVKQPKKKKMKNKKQPVVVTLQPRSSYRRDSGGTFVRADTEDNDPCNDPNWGYPQRFHGEPMHYERPYHYEEEEQYPRGLWSTADLHSPQNSDDIETFLSVLHALLKDRPAKSMLTWEDELVDLFNNFTEVNQRVSELGGLQQFLIQYGEPYRLTADDEYVYLLEDSSSEERDYCSEEDEFPRLRMRSATPSTDIGDTPSPRKISQENTEMDLERLQALKAETAELEQQLAVAREEAARTEREQREIVAGMTSRRDDLADALKEMQAYRQKERQKWITNSNNWKSELANLTDKANGLRFASESKEADIRKLQTEISSLKKRNERVSVQPKHCTCSDSVKKGEKRASAAETALLKMKKEIQIRWLEEAYGNGNRTMTKLTASVKSIPPTEYASLFDACVSYTRQVQDCIRDMEQHYMDHIRKVENGMPLSSLPTISAPELSQLPTLPTPDARKVGETSGKKAGPGSSGHQSAAVGGGSSSSDVRKPSDEKEAAAVASGPAAIPASLEQNAEKSTMPKNTTESTCDEGASSTATADKGAGKAVEVRVVVAAVMKELPKVVKSQVTDAIRKFRSQNGGTFSGLGQDDLIASICNLLKETHGDEGLERGGTNNEECMICFYKLASAETLTMVCGHVTHEKCIRQWLNMNEGKACPVCDH